MNLKNNSPKWKYNVIRVNVGIYCLTCHVNIGYNIPMFGDIISFVLRILLIASLWLFVWRFVKPRSKLMRVLRAALLVLVLFAVLTALKATGIN